MFAWYIWIIIGVILLICEAFVPIFFLACLGIGCFASAVISLLGLGFTPQLIAFGISILVMFIIIRPLALKILYSKKDVVETNVDALIGKKGVVIKRINNIEGSGRVKIVGEDWKAISSDNSIIEKGQEVIVERVEGVKLIVKPVHSLPTSSPHPSLMETETMASNQVGMNETEAQIILPGTKLAQHYEIIELVGKGGMGAVYKAKQLTLGRIVALKVLPPSFAKNKEFVERFDREAKVLAELNHPNIVSIYDKVVDEDMIFFVMEYVDGVNLRRFLLEKKLPPKEALELILQICNALDYAHSQGVVHRDIKPENILIDKKRCAKITDFGIARIFWGQGVESNLTKTDIIIGTYDYMAPEQRTNPKKVDQRADIYSLGVIIYEMLTGELPLGKFKLPSEKVKVNSEIDKIVLKALEKEPESRYQKVSDLSTDLTNVTKNM